MPPDARLHSQLSANELQQMTFSAMLTLGSATVICYDYALTLHREIRFVWKHRLSAVSVLFYVTRYAAIVAAVALAWGTIADAVELARSFTVCYAGPSLTGVTSPVFILCLVFSGLRAYAMSGRNVWSRSSIRNSQSGDQCRTSPDSGNTPEVKLTSAEQMVFVVFYQAHLTARERRCIPPAADCSALELYPELELHSYLKIHLGPSGSPSVSFRIDSLWRAPSVEFQH
ncbi:hypothetical protein C8Q79DRAFT_922389 [Trametes meyenii]|nr:hypothetical protein C8Q79DRAFT_922389 [Trametes meyenii]